MIACMRLYPHPNIICINYNFHETLIYTFSVSLFQLIIVFVSIMLPHLDCNFEILFCTNLSLFHLCATNYYSLNENAFFCHIFIFKQNY